MSVKGMKLEIYTRDWCPYCRRAKALLDSKGLEYQEIEISNDRDLQQEMKERSGGEYLVPQLFLNDEYLGSYDRLIEMETSGEFNQMLELEVPDYTQQLWDLVIIGAGPAGQTAALYAARKGIDTLMVATAMGGQVVETDIVDNYSGKPEIKGPDLMYSFWEHTQNYGLSAMLGERVEEIKADNNHYRLLTSSGKDLSTKTVIIATGTNKRTLGVKREKRLKGKGVHYCTICDGILYAGQSVAVVGGGNSAMEAALDMSKLDSRVSLIVRGDSLSGDQLLQEKVAASDLIEVHYNSNTQEIVGADSLEKVVIRDRNTGKVTELEVKAVFIQIGLIPNSGFVSKLLELNKRKEILIDEDNSTSLEGIWAAGDVSSIKDKQIIVAAGEGAKAALRVNEYLK